VILPLPPEDGWDDEEITDVIVIAEQTVPNHGRALRQTRETTKKRERHNETFEGLIAQLAVLKL
jgi:hypothetical protein